MTITSQQAEPLLKAWEPRLIKLKQLYTTDTARLYPGLVAFCGLQLTLWPMWLRACDENGRTLTDVSHDYNVDDPALHTFPWFAIMQPTSPRTAWVLVRGKALPESAQTFQGLMHKDVVQSLASLDETGKVITTGDARDYLSRWGALNGADKPLNLPMAHCEKLAQDWKHWWEAAQPLKKPLGALVREATQSCSGDEELRQAFLSLAAEIWQQLLSSGFIQAGPFSGNSFLKIFGLRKSVNQFNGLMLLLGDHHMLWNEIQWTITNGS